MLFFFYFVVAPYMGAWIEIISAENLSKLSYLSHPTWVRGLKFFKIALIFFILFESHPTWVRGLKFKTLSTFEPVAESHPTWVRGLK